jgi:hypothetical protein
MVRKSQNYRTLDWSAVPKLFETKSDKNPKLRKNTSVENVWIRSIYGKLKQVEEAGYELEVYVNDQEKNNDKIVNRKALYEALKEFYEQKWKVNGLFKTDKLGKTASMTRLEMQSALQSLLGGILGGTNLHTQLVASRSWYEDQKNETKVLLKEFYTLVDKMDAAGHTISFLRADMDKLGEKNNKGKPNVTKETEIMDLDTWITTGERPPGAKTLRR